MRAFSLRTFRAQLIDLPAHFDGGLAPAAQVLFGALPFAGNRFQLELPLRHGLGKRVPRRAQALQFGRGGLLLLLHARRFALDSRQVFVHLRELVAQRGDFAQQPQHGGAAGLDGLLALA